MIRPKMTGIIFLAGRIEKWAGEAEVVIHLN
jgi:hypothetical protein